MNRTADPYNLQRFVDAQAHVYPEVCAELRRGRKSGHWIWFIFPQIAGLGQSETSRRFAINSLDEAKAYLEHPVLGPRLLECTNFVMNVEGRTLREVLGYPDDLKFRSSMTLFAHAAPDNRLFEEALRRYSDSEHDPLTLKIIREIRRA